MPKIQKPSTGFKIFAEQSQTGERTIFGDAASSDALPDAFTPEFLRGWGIVNSNDAPTKQDFNALGFTLSKMIKYLEQEGVAEWIPQVEYFADTVKKYNGVLYLAKADHSGVSTTPDNDAAHWVAITGDLVALENKLTQAISGNTAALNGLSTTVSGHTSTLGTLGTTVSGHTTTLGTLGTTVSGHTSTLGAHSGQISNQSSTLGTHTSDIASNKQEIASLKSLVNSVTSGSNSVVEDQKQVDLWLLGIKIIGDATKAMFLNRGHTSWTRELKWGSSSSIIMNYSLNGNLAFQVASLNVYAITSSTSSDLGGAPNTALGTYTSVDDAKLDYFFGKSQAEQTSYLQTIVPFQLYVAKLGKEVAQNIGNSSMLDGAFVLPLRKNITIAPQDDPVIFSVQMSPQIGVANFTKNYIIANSSVEQGSRSICDNLPSQSLLYSNFYIQVQNKAYNNTQDYIKSFCGRYESFIAYLIDFFVNGESNFLSEVYSKILKL